MTVTNAPSSTAYAGDNASTAFPIAFNFYDPSDIVVIFTDVASGVDTVQTTGYTITGGAGGQGVVTFTIAPLVGTTVTIARNVQIIQPDVFVEGNQVSSSVFQARFDKEIMISQQLQTTLNRSLTAPVTEVNASLVLPNILTRAGNLLGFDTSGNPAAYSSSTLTSAAATAVAAANTANADVLLTHADVLLTHADVVTTGQNAATATAAASNAATSAIAAGSTFTSTSTTSNAIASSGTKTFATQANKGYFSGQYIAASSGGNTMSGTVASYDNVGGSLVINVTASSGSGTFSSWSIGVIGQPGTSGTGSGTVTAVSGTNTNGVNVTVTSPNSTPAITVALGAIGPSSVSATGTVFGSNISGSTSGSNTGDQYQSVSANTVLANGTAATGAATASVTLSPSTLLGRGPSGNLVPITMGSGISIVGTALQSAAGTAVVSVKSQVFTASGTYTPSTGMLYCIVEAVGAGGGGSSSTNSGGGGQAGSYAKSVLSAATVGSGQAVTIGTAGSATSANAAGSTGSTTSLGTLVVATGGVGGAATTGVGGYGSGTNTGDISSAGQPGSSGITTLGAGAGGSTLYGQGGLGNNAGTGLLGTGYGAGGGGGKGSVVGRPGTSGVMYITEFCSV